MTGYHLRERVWHEHLENDAIHRTRVGVQSESEFNAKVNREHPQFVLVRAVTNGSKHFKRDTADPVTGKHTGAFASSAFSKAFDVDHLVIETDGKHRDVEDVLGSLLVYWESFFAANLR